MALAAGGVAARNRTTGPLIHRHALRAPPDRLGGDGEEHGTARLRPLGWNGRRRRIRLDAGGHEGRNGRSMTITLLHAVLAIVLAANAVVAFAAISKIEEPGSTSAHRE